MRTDTARKMPKKEMLFEAAQVRRRPHVIVADDDNDVRAAIVRVLGARCDVIEASSGTDLLRRFAAGIFDAGASVPDLIVSDQRMPGLSGLEVLAGLRSNDWSTPFILVTGAADEEVRAEARRLGAAAVLAKPLEAGRLRALVAQLLQLPG